MPKEIVYVAGKKVNLFGEKKEQINLVKLRKETGSDSLLWGILGLDKDNIVDVLCICCETWDKPDGSIQNNIAIDFKYMNGVHTYTDPNVIEHPELINNNFHEFINHEYYTNHFVGHTRKRGIYVKFRFSIPMEILQDL